MHLKIILSPEYNITWYFYSFHSDSEHLPSSLNVICFGPTPGISPNSSKNHGNIRFLSVCDHVLISKHVDCSDTVHHNNLSQI